MRIASRTSSISRVRTELRICVLVRSDSILQARADMMVSYSFALFIPLLGYPSSAPMATRPRSRENDGESAKMAAMPMTAAVFAMARTIRICNAGTDVSVFNALGFCLIVPLKVLIISTFYADSVRLSVPSASVHDRHGGHEQSGGVLFMCSFITRAFRRVERGIPPFASIPFRMLPHCSLRDTLQYPSFSPL